ncbi:hypothetical protein ACWDBD_36945 [Streptomyces sp. NPDC001118]
MTKHRRGGRIGQSFTATPRLRSYSMPPASKVTVIQPDGTTEIQPAEAPKKSGEPGRAAKPVPKEQRRSNGGPQCAICHKPLRRGQPRAQSKSGKDCHEGCLATARAAGAGK